MIPKLKICGMKHNVMEVASLHPDYLGFIFYDQSPRNFKGKVANLPNTIDKVGVFVNAPINEILLKAREFELNTIQLHGDETQKYVMELREKLELNFNVPINIWKVFLMDDSFEFEQLSEYEPLVDAFLFDTKSDVRGGSGKKFNWEVLSKYNSRIPLVLSGGISLTDIPAIKYLLNQTQLPILAIDINSKFEKEPGLKEIEALKEFIHELQR